MHRKIPLPRGWSRQAKSAILHILALSHYKFLACPIQRREGLIRRFRSHQESVDQYTVPLIFWDCGKFNTSTC